MPSEWEPALDATVDIVAEAPYSPTTEENAFLTYLDGRRGLEITVEQRALLNAIQLKAYMVGIST